MLELKDLSSIAQNYKDVLETQVSRVDLTANLGIPLDDPALMGVINLSPDSWYRESICLSVDSAVQRGRVLFEQGASIVDIGAESTVEQAQRVSGEEQQERLLPVIHQLSAAGIVVSTETYNVKVAEACLEAGAKVLNFTGTVQNVCRLGQDGPG